MVSTDSRTTISTLTTSQLLKLEQAGGVISDALLPNGIATADTVETWFSTFPFVDRTLIQRWYDAYQAKTALQKELDRLTAIE
jgi:hypothetical protein